MSAGMIIVGAGEAGARAATTLRDGGYEGPVTLIGDEPHGPYERPPLSKAVMTDEAVDRPPFILDEARLAERDIRHLAGVRATRLDTAARSVVLDDGSTLSYEKLLIATGARPRRLPLPGADERNVLYLRTFADALALRGRLQAERRLVVIGGGFIGLEVAASAIARGCAVTLVEVAPRILMRGVPAEVADLVRERHERAGVLFRTGVAIERIERRDDRGEAVILADGSALPCDLVVAGIGAVPETTLAEAGGIATDNGVSVDGHLRTSDPHVFAAGDCCSFPHPLYDGRRLRLEAWRNAQDQGALAARNMLGAGEDFSALPWFWSDQYDQTLQVVGLPDEGRDLVRRESGEGRLFFHIAEGGRLVAASGIGPGNSIARDVKLAEMMIARRLSPDPALLASSDVKLKSFL